MEQGLTVALSGGSTAGVSSESAFLVVDSNVVSQKAPFVTTDSKQSLFVCHDSKLADASSTAVTVLETGKGTKLTTISDCVFDLYSITADKPQQPDKYSDRAPKVVGFAYKSQNQAFLEGLVRVDQPVPS